MIGGGDIITARSGLLGGQVRRKQSSHPSRQPSASLPKPAHRATSSGSLT
jgi:hypothetical protein